MKNMKKIIVTLNNRSYPIFIAKNILYNKSLLLDINERNFSIVTTIKIISFH